MRIRCGRVAGLLDRARRSFRVLVLVDGAIALYFGIYAEERSDCKPRSILGQTVWVRRGSWTFKN